MGFGPRCWFMFGLTYVLLLFFKEDKRLMLQEKLNSVKDPYALFSLTIVGC